MQMQEIFYTTWNGTSWDPPTQLTNNIVPDGRASISGDLLGATLAWVENTGGLVSTPEKMRIAITEWNPASNTWDTPILLNSNPLGDAMNVQPSTARLYLPAGLSDRAVAWTVDFDGNPSTNSDRRIVVARWTAAGGWSSPAYDLTNQNLPGGAKSPSLSFDPQTQLAHMAFLVRTVDGDGATNTGVGNRSMLWSADSNVDKFWIASPVMDKGITIYAEKPTLQISNTGEKLLVFRRFGAPGTNAVLGQLAISQGVSGGYSAPLYMTDAPVNHWLQSFSINPVSGDAMVINVNRSTIMLNQAISLTNATTTPIATSTTHSFTSGNDSVETFNVSAAPDLAVDPTLGLSVIHAIAGETVVVTATLENLGRGVATSGAVPISVCLFSGVPPTGIQLGCNDLPAGDSLGYNTSLPMTFDIVANGSEQPIYAQVFSNGENGNPSNDIATSALGAIPAPILTSVTQDMLYLVNALGIRWVPPLIMGVSGFRILRSTDAGVTYELVGETSGSYLADLLVTRGVNYCYVVQAYDTAGTLSAKSNQVCASVKLLGIHLPLIKR